MSTEDPNLIQVTKNMSEVNQDAINANTEQIPKPAAKSPAPSSSQERAAKGLTDRHGRAFDPSLHEVDAEGNPKLNRDGFLAGKPGRPGKSEKPSFSMGEDAQTPQDTPNVKSVIQNQNAAKITTALFIKLGVAAFGDEWYPQKFQIQDMNVTVDEQKEMITAFEEYFKSKGVKDLTPGWTLVLTLAGYAAMRMNQQKTQSRFKVFAGKLMNAAGKALGGLSAMFSKLIKGVKKSATHVNTRDDGERKDNPGTQASGGLQTPGDTGSGS